MQVGVVVRVGAMDDTDTIGLGEAAGVQAVDRRISTASRRGPSGFRIKN